MTYEMAGGGRGGLALTLPDGTVLTLADRVARHLTTSLATVRTAAANAHRLLADFAANRAGAAGESARTFLWTADQPEARALADLLALHGVRVRQLARQRDRQGEAPGARRRGGRATSASPPAPTRSRPRSRSATWSAR